MKKYILPIILSTALTANSEEVDKYLKLSGSINKLSDFKKQHVELRNHESYMLSLGLGYNISEDSRFELNVERHLNTRPSIENNMNHTFKNAKYKLISYSFDIYQNIVKLNNADIFIGVGTGITKAKLKYRNTITNNLISEKPTMNKTLKLTSGFTYYICEDHKIDISYKYKDVGKISKHMKLRSHAVNIAYRLYF